MSKVYIAGHQRAVRTELTGILNKMGHEVQEISGGQEAIDLAAREAMDLLMLDAELPGIDGYQVLAKLKEAPQTASIPVIMLTSEFSNRSEAMALRLGANYILSKRFNPDNLAMTVRMAIREGQTVSGVVPTSPPAVDGSWENPTSENSGENAPEEAQARKPQGLIDTAGKIAALEDLLNGGIRPGSMTMIEGGSDSGKSVICEYLTYGAVTAGFDVAYFSSQHTAGSLARQMDSIGLDLSSTPGEYKLMVYPLPSSMSRGDPEAHLAQVASNIDAIAGGLVVIDDISSLVAICDNKPVLNFFLSCQRMCKEGKTIVVTAHSAYFEKDLLSRMNQLFMTNIILNNQIIGGRPISTLGAPRINNAENRENNGFSFQVEPGTGIKKLPIYGIKI